MTLPPLLVSLLILKIFLQPSPYYHFWEETMDWEVLAFFTWSATYEKQLL